MGTHIINTRLQNMERSEATTPCRVTIWLLDGSAETLALHSGMSAMTASHRKSFQ